MAKRVLFIVNTLGRAGAETALINLMKKMQSLGGYEIDLYTIIPRGEMFARVPQGVRILNRKPSLGSVLSLQGRLYIAGRIAKAFLYRGTGFRLLPEICRNLRAQKKATGRVQLDKALWRLLAEGAPDLPESYDLAVAYIEGASAYFLADKVRARKKAAFIHIDYKQAGYTPEMDQGCYDQVDQVFVVSNEVGEKFCGVYPQYRKKVRLFRNLLDPETIRTRAKEPGFTDDFAGVRLVTVGRLHYQKGYDVAIEACEKLVQDGYDVRWYILGEGAERQNLEKLIDRRGMRERFLLMGAKDNPYPYVAQADLYVHATRFEGKSIAIEEAQILGKAIIASDCTGNTEQITDGVDGLLLTLNAENLARTIERAIDDPALCERLRENVKKRELSHPEDLQAMLALMN